MKSCSTCKTSRPLNQFNKSSKSKDGLSNRCKSCHCKANISFNEKKRERNRLKKLLKEDKLGKVCAHCKTYKLWEQYHKDKAISNGYDSICKDCKKAQKIRDRSRDQTRQRFRYQNDPAYRAARASQHAKRHPKSIRILRGRNKALLTARTRRYQTAKLRALPQWANLEAIKEIYQQALNLSSATGKSYQVDHIDPLQHKLVVGLHTEENLQILEASLNQSKGNKFTPYRIDDLGNKYILNKDEWLPQ